MGRTVSMGWMIISIFEILKSLITGNHNPFSFGLNFYHMEETQVPFIPPSLPKRVLTIPRVPFTFSIMEIVGKLQ